MPWEASSAWLCRTANSGTKRPSDNTVLLQKSLLIA